MAATRTLQDPRGAFTGPVTTTSVEGPEGWLFLARDQDGVRLTELVTMDQLRAWMRALDLTF